MGCGCGSAAKRREMLRTSRSSPTRDGGFLLLTYPDCTTLYQGTADDSAYVVGRNTEFERLFVRADLTEATQYAIDTRQSLENIPYTGLCSQAVEDLLAV